MLHADPNMLASNWFGGNEGLSPGRSPLSTVPTLGIGLDSRRSDLGLSGVDRGLRHSNVARERDSFRNSNTLNS